MLGVIYTNEPDRIEIHYIGFDYKEKIYDIVYQWGCDQFGKNNICYKCDEIHNMHRYFIVNDECSYSLVENATSLLGNRYTNTIKQFKIAETNKFKLPVIKSTPPQKRESVQSTPAVVPAQPITFDNVISELTSKISQS